jgi:hypothetical protein
LRDLWLEQFVEDSGWLNWPDTGSLEAGLDTTAVEASIASVLIDHDEAPL